MDYNELKIYSPHTKLWLNSLFTSFLADDSFWHHYLECAREVVGLHVGNNLVEIWMPHQQKVKIRYCKQQNLISHLKTYAHSWYIFFLLSTFMIHDHIGCAWLYLTRHLKNPILCGLASLNILNLTNLPWHHFIHISYTYASCIITYHIHLSIHKYTHSQMENDVPKHNSFTNISYIHK